MPILDFTGMNLTANDIYRATQGLERMRYLCNATNVKYSDVLERAGYEALKNELDVISNNFKDKKELFVTEHLAMKDFAEFLILGTEVAKDDTMKEFKRKINTLEKIKAKACLILNKCKNDNKED